MLLINVASLSLEHVEQITQSLVEKRYLNMTAIDFRAIFQPILLAILLTGLTLSFVQLPKTKQ